MAEQKTKKKSNKNGATTTSKRPSTAANTANANANNTATATTVSASAAAVAAGAVSSNGIINVNGGGKTPTVITKNSSDEIQKTQNRKKQHQQQQQQQPPKANASVNATAAGQPGAHVTTASTVSDNGTTNAIRIVQSSKPAKKVNKTSEMLETISNATVNTKLDEVLQTVRQLDNTCDFGRCRTKTSLIGQDCTLCQQRFCMKHQLPEIHGCGGAIKKEQRTEFLKPRPTLPAALRRNEQKDAHARLEQKLKEMSLARQKARK